MESRQNKVRVLLSFFISYPLHLYLRCGLIIDRQCRNLPTSPLVSEELEGQTGFWFAPYYCKRSSGGKTRRSYSRD